MMLVAATCKTTRAPRLTRFVLGSDGDCITGNPSAFGRVRATASAIEKGRFIHRFIPGQVKSGHVQIISGVSKAC
jgi:hypothetical protein